MVDGWYLRGQRKNLVKEQPDYATGMSRGLHEKHCGSERIGIQFTGLFHNHWITLHNQHSTLPNGSMIITKIIRIILSAVVQ